MRLHEIVILRMKTWLPAETLKELQWAEAFRREQVRVQFRILECYHTTAPSVLSSKDESDSRK
jgi:hypothetical protein